MTEILARCGYRCDLCPAYLRNLHSFEDRQRVSDGWVKYVGVQVPPEQLGCHGCLEKANLLILGAQFVPVCLNEDWKTVPTVRSSAAVTNLIQG